MRRLKRPRPEPDVFLFDAVYVGNSARQLVDD
jgi:hypothetical protein